MEKLVHNTNGSLTLENLFVPGTKVKHTHNGARGYIMDRETTDPAKYCWVHYTAVGWIGLEFITEIEGLRIVEE